jgi:hypothetical protein
MSLSVSDAPGMSQTDIRTEAPVQTVPCPRCGEAGTPRASAKTWTCKGCGKRNAATLSASDVEPSPAIPGQRDGGGLSPPAPPTRCRRPRRCPLAGIRTLRGRSSCVTGLAPFGPSTPRRPLVRRRRRRKLYWAPLFLDSRIGRRAAVRPLRGRSSGLSRRSRSASADGRGSWPSHQSWQLACVR